MTIDTFVHILRCYGALHLPPIPEGPRRTVPETRRHVTLSLVQFEWTLKLLTRSLELWPEAYETEELTSLAETLLKLGMDSVGVVLLKPIQDCLEACVMALPDWKDYTRQLAVHLCGKTPLELQVRFIRVVKSTCPRCLYFRRMAALLALELALFQDKDPTPEETFDSKALCPLLDSDRLFPHLVDTLENPRHVFLQNDPDYRKLSNCIYLLDYIIGAAPLELAENSVRSYKQGAVTEQ